MTESEWLACREPMPMLAYLGDAVGDRKRRLFCCACCRLVWDFLIDDASRKAVELAERYADGAAPENEVARARGTASAAKGPAAMAAYWSIKKMTADVVVGVVEGVVNAGAWSAGDAERRAGASAQDQVTAYDEAVKEVHAAEAALIREVFGNPFRDMPIAAVWLDWNGGAIGKLAEAIYRQRRFDELPLLADALAEAGCEDSALLDHFQSIEGHTRGCWALDALRERAL